MEEQLALIRTIAANPDDDTPRLIYADWLDESGDEINRARAELIRLDIRMHALPPGSEERQRMRSHDWAQMLPLANAWWKELPKIDGLTWGWFERGFVEHVITRYETLCESRELVFDSAPIVSLCLNEINFYEVLALCDQPWMERITRLELKNARTTLDFMDAQDGLAITSEVAIALIRSPYLARVRRLVLRCDMSLRVEGLWGKLIERFGEVF